LAKNRNSVKDQKEAKNQRLQEVNSCFLKSYMAGSIYQSLAVNDSTDFIDVYLKNGEVFI